MKVKNIMFSGVMAAILSATGASAAISVASQGYVDEQVGAVAQSVTNLETTVANTYLTEEQVQQEITNVVGTAQEGVLADVAANKSAIETLQTSKADADDVYTKSDVYTKTETDNLLGAKQDQIQLGANLMWGEDGKLTTTGIATNDSFDNLERDVNTLKGDATQEGSVAYDIAEALKTYSTTEQVKALDAETLQSAKDYADGLAGNYDLAGAAASALSEAKSYTDTQTADMATKTELKDYAKQADLTAEITARETAVKAVDDKLADYTTTEVLTGQLNAKANVADVYTKTQADDAFDAAGSADAVEAKLKLLATADVPAVCESESSMCVLSFDGTKYYWTPLTKPLETAAE